MESIYSLIYILPLSKKIANNIAQIVTSYNTFPPILPQKTTTTRRGDLFHITIYLISLIVNSDSILFFNRQNTTLQNATAPTSF